MMINRSSTSPPLARAIPAAGTRLERRDQRLLRLLESYRLVVAILLLLLFTFADRYIPYGHYDQQLALYACGAWLLFAAAPFLMPDHFARNGSWLHLQIVVDIAAITLLIHASGGVSSGLGMLLILPLALTGVILPVRMGAMFAALAALALLGNELYSHVSSSFAADYFQAGLAGLIFFATSLLASLLAQHLRESERHIARQSHRLADLTRLNEHIIQQMQSGIVVVDAGGRIHHMNRAAARMLQVEDAPSTPATIHEMAPELGRENGAQPSQLLPVRKGKLLARITPLEGNGSDCRLIHLEESTELEQQAQQMKLASLGRLTASIAHELRNPIGAISHAEQLLAESPRLNDADRRLIEIIRNQAGRVNTIVESVLQLGRGRPASGHRLPLRPWLEGVVAEFRELAAGREGLFAIQITPPEMEILFDPDQLQQVVWNLCQNSLHACTGEPRIELRGAVDPRSGAPFLEIRDNGPGVAPGLEQQIFEPFFTTDSTSTGLGLYIVRELCSANRARIGYSRCADGGACFRIEFSRGSTS